MFDLLFWSVVGLVLWFTYDTYKHIKIQRAIQNRHNLEMESINERTDKGTLG